MEKGAQLYEGKAKKVFATEDPDLLIVSYKDDATAFNGQKRGTIEGKGIINNRMSNALMRMLQEHEIPTHFVEELSDRDTLVKKVNIVPLEVIVRNISAGSFAKNYGVDEGLVFSEPTVEYSYKNDALGDPLLNESHALALGLATREELEQNVTQSAADSAIVPVYIHYLRKKVDDGFPVKLLRTVRSKGYVLSAS
jgi:phosphoribosylaminoimidazole-succinocarboxamide synthase